MDNKDIQKLFNNLNENTFIFDDIQFNVNCIKSNIDDLLIHDDLAVSNTAYHMAKIITLLNYWRITK